MRQPCFLLLAFIFTGCDETPASVNRPIPLETVPEFMEEFARSWQTQSASGFEALLGPDFILEFAESEAQQIPPNFWVRQQAVDKFSAFFAAVDSTKVHITYSNSDTVQVGVHVDSIEVWSPERSTISAQDWVFYLLPEDDGHRLLLAFWAAPAIFAKLF